MLFMKNYRYLAYSIVFTILGFGLWIALDDAEKIFASIRQIGWHGFVFICFFSIANYSLRYVRWVYLLKQLGDRTPFWDGLVCYLSGFALTTTPGKAGEAVRSLYYHRRHGVHHAHTLAAILSERASDALSSMLLALMAIYTFEHYRWIGVGFSLVIAAVILSVHKPGLLLYVCQQLRVVRLRFFQRLLDLVPVFIERASSLLTVRTLTVGSLFGLVSWSAEAYAFAWLAHSLGGEASYLLYMSIFAIGMVAGAATFLPGGLGGAEVLMYVLLKLTGMGDAEAITVTLLCRLATLWFAVALGLLSLLWLENTAKKPQVE